MRILAIGDVVGSVGCKHLNHVLPDFKKENNIDLTIANGENSAEGNGITPTSAKYILNSGVDIITTGNHVFRKSEIFSFIKNAPVLRPMNYPYRTPGSGYCIIEINNVRVCVINILGVVFMESMNSPFETAENALYHTQDCPIKIIDFHAEATAEKRALGYYLDGKISAFFGTHTHIQTADEQILPKGTGYITDIGMTGPLESVLGIKKECSIRLMKDKLPVKFEEAGGACKMDCVIFDIDENTGKTTKVERYRV